MLGFVTTHLQGVGASNLILKDASFTSSHLNFSDRVLAFSVGSEQAVNNLTERLHSDGYEVVDGPRRTGDGYYESVVLDPDGNPIEITV